MRAAVLSGDARKLAELLIRQDPGFDVNNQAGDGFSLLHHACCESHRSAVLPLLLAHPDIDVDVKNNGAGTPLCYASGKGLTSRVREMLKDSRVKVNENNNGYTLLYWAAHNGHIDIIKWWIASGREVDLGKPGEVKRPDAVGIAMERGHAGVVTLLERFQENPVETRGEVRKELGITG